MGCGFRGPLGRGQCSVCGKVVAVQKNGTAIAHHSRASESPLGYGRCRGAGVKADPLARDTRYYDTQGRPDERSDGPS